MTDDTPSPDIPVEVEPAAEPDKPPADDRIAALEKDKQDTYERLLRTAADFDNYKKRVRRETEEAKLKVREEVLREILPGIDNLERALAAAAGTEGGVVDGIKL